MNEKILISIVAYKESELRHTVKALYNDAENKDRLLFSVVCQDVKFPHLSSVIPKEQLRYIRVLPNESWGVCWARSVAQSHFSDYDYYLQLDAHMFSQPGWDVSIIKAFKEADSIYSKPILSAYPAEYSISSSGKRLIKPASQHGMPLISSLKVNGWPEIVLSPDKYPPSYYLQGACIFASKDFVEQVPVDPEVTFRSEEITLSVRAWIAGFTVVNFKAPTFYHLYWADRQAAKASTSPWAEKNVNADYMNDDIRANKFFAGELTGLYGARLDDIKAFMKETGYRDKRTKS